MNENPKEASKFSRFFEEKGFYIILFLCVAAIGIAGYVLFFDPANTDDDSALVSDNGDTAEANLGGEVIRPGKEVDLATDEGNQIPVTGGSDAISSGDDAVEANTEPDEPALDSDAVIRDAADTISSGRKDERARRRARTSPRISPRMRRSRTPRRRSSSARFRARCCVIIPATSWFMTARWATGARTTALTSWRRTARSSARSRTA